MDPLFAFCQNLSPLTAHWSRSGGLYEKPTNFFFYQPLTTVPPPPPLKIALYAKNELNCAIGCEDKRHCVFYALPRVSPICRSPARHDRPGLCFDVEVCLCG